MASLSEMLQLAEWKQQRASSMGTMNRISNLVQSINNIAKQRKEKEKRERLSKIIKRGIETGELKQEYKITPTGEITQEYKTPEKKTNYVSSVNEAKKRIEAGEDINKVTGELKGEFGVKHTERMDAYLEQFVPKTETGEPTSFLINTEKEKNITKAIERYKELASKEGWQLNIDSNLPVVQQLQNARKLFALKKGETKKYKITPTTALSIISDPFKSQQLKRQYPELYAEIEKIANKSLDKEIFDNNKTIKENNIMDTNW